MRPKISVIIPVYNVVKYIEKMLLSVKNQTFRDYEVIIVNDGSTDGSQKIIDRFCQEDGRFKSIIKENGGVASARNRGLEEANGEFVVFYDPDDFIPRKALAALYRSIGTAGADMAIGVMKEVHAGETRCNSHTINLGKKKEISKYDLGLSWSFSVCNKLFRREMIVRNNFQFPVLKHAEDAVFLFQCIFASRRIVGCKEIVYEYHFRPFWESRSATQMIKTAYLQDVIEALDCLESMILTQISLEKGQEKNRAEQFLNEFRVRYLHVSLLSGYYRQLWMAENEVLDIIRNKAEKLKQGFSNAMWSRVVGMNPDLQLEKKLYSKADVLENAVLTFVIRNGLERSELSQLLQSIYNQSMPMFRIIMDEAYQEMIPEDMRKENIIFSQKCDIAEGQTEFVMITDAHILSSKNAIRLMVNALLKDKNLDFATIPMVQYIEGQYYGTLQETAFTAIQCIKNKKSKYDRLDEMIGNKVFRKDKIGALSKLKQKKVSNSHMICTCDLRELMPDDNKMLESARVRIKKKQKDMENIVISYIKNRYTKADVKKFLRKEI